MLGPALIALAALLWASDTPFRLPALNRVDPVFLVFVEHVIGTACVAVWVFSRARGEAFRLKAADWLAAMAVGAGGSALATVFFTASFGYVNPSLTILLQKLQPILVIFLAYLFLKERPREGFFAWAAVAILAALVLSFPDFDFSFVGKALSEPDGRSKGVLYALGAASLWAIATVAGKGALSRVKPGIMTFWRYVFGLVTLAGMLALSDAGADWNALASSNELAGSLLYIGLIPGLLAMVAYYHGLTRTPASVTTLVELFYPVSAIAINTLWLGQPLQSVQLAAGAILLLAVTQVSRR